MEESAVQESLPLTPALSPEGRGGACATPKISGTGLVDPAPKTSQSATSQSASHPLPGFLDVPADFASFEGARVLILPVPYEQTTTYLKGTSGGPAAVLRASTQVEFYDEVLGTEPFRAGIHTLPPLDATGPPEAVINRIAERVASLPADRLVVILGGEHTVALGALKAHRQRHPDLGLLVLDAHDDLREEYAGSRLNHACISRRASELVPVVQVGVRSVCGERPTKPPAMVRTFLAHQIHRTGMPTEAIIKGLPASVYLSVDADVFDPAYCPGVGTPEPGGLDWYQVTDLIAAVAARRRIVGFDVVEVRPLPDQVASEFLAARLAYRAIGLILKAQGWTP